MEASVTLSPKKSEISSEPWVLEEVGFIWHLMGQSCVVGVSGSSSRHGRFFEGPRFFFISLHHPSDFHTGLRAREYAVQGHKAERVSL